MERHCGAVELDVCGDSGSHFVIQPGARRGSAAAAGAAV